MYPYYLTSHDSLVGYYSGLPKDSLGFEDLLVSVATEIFPLDEGKPIGDEGGSSSIASSPLSSSSRESLSSSSSRIYDDVGAYSDSDGDVEGLLPEHKTDPHSQLLRMQSLPPLGDNTPFLTSRCSYTCLDRLPTPQQGGAAKYTRSHSSPIIISPSPKKLRNPAQNPVRSYLASEDANHEADDESDGRTTDEEYTPYPETGPRKYRRNSSTSKRRARILAATCTQSNRSEYKPVKRARLPPLSRNKQVTSSATMHPAIKLSKLNFTCPECGWKQANERMPDFKRHLRTHTRPSTHDRSQGWWCKGVRLDEAAAYDIPTTAESYLFLDVWRVGGCQRTFARRDALKRHLDNKNVACVGKPCEATED